MNPAFTGPVILGKPSQWFNPNAFLAPPAGSGFYGNLGRDTLIGPGLATWDWSNHEHVNNIATDSMRYQADLVEIVLAYRLRPEQRCSLVRKLAHPLAVQ